VVSQEPAEGLRFGLVLLSRHYSIAEIPPHTGKSCLEYYIKHLESVTNKAIQLYGTYECLDPDNPRTWSYIRRSKHACYLVILNFSADAASCSYTQEGLTLHGARLLICNYNTKTESTEDPLVLRPYEGRLYKLKIFESE